MTFQDATPATVEETAAAVEEAAAGSDSGFDENGGGTPSCQDAWFITSGSPSESQVRRLGHYSIWVRSTAPS